MAHSAWPFSELSIGGPRVTLRGTTDEHFLGLFKAMHGGVHPEGTESASFPPSALSGAELEEFARRSWLGNRQHWSIDHWWLDLTVFMNTNLDVPVGMQVLSARDFLNQRQVTTASWLSRNFQGRGLGTEMRRLALDFAFLELGATSAISETFPENMASARVSVVLGYESLGSEVITTPTGENFQLDRFRVDRKSWLSASRAELSVQGLDACAHRFGL